MTKQKDTGIRRILHFNAGKVEQSDMPQRCDQRQGLNLNDGVHLNGDVMQFFEVLNSYPTLIRQLSDVGGLHIHLHVGHTTMGNNSPITGSIYVQVGNNDVIDNSQSVGNIQDSDVANVNTNLKNRKTKRVFEDIG
jgi:hypothetical protein